MFRLIIYLIFISNVFCINVRAFVDKNIISEDDIITYKIEIENASSIGEINIGKLDNIFSIISGPNQQTSMQFVNGNMTKSKTFSWNLSPQRSGKLVIPSFNITIDNKKYKTNPISINVKTTNKKNNDLSIYLSAEIDKEEVYIGEQITLTYKLYKKNEVSIEQFQPPTFTGFWTEELYRPNQLKFKKVNINGVRYDVSTLYKVALFPISGSKHTIDPLIIKAQVQKRKARRSRDPFFDPFFDSFFTESETKVLRSNKRKITIKQFPKPLPGAFSGAVGKFNIKTLIDTDSTRVNEAITFQVQISGTGNLGLFTLPKFEFSDQVDQFPPTEKFEKNVFRDQLSGSMIWEYILVPRESGIVKIPPISMTYFDPKKEKWERINSKSLMFSVKKAEGNFYTDKGFSKKEIELLDRDIRYIRNNTSKWSYKSKNEWENIFKIYLASFIVFFFPLLSKSILGYNDSKKSIWRSKKALAKARKSINKNEKLLKIIFTYLYDRMGLQSDNLDSIIVKELLKNKIDRQLLHELLEHLKICDEISYGLNNEINLEAFKQKTLDILEKMDAEI